MKQPFVFIGHPFAKTNKCNSILEQLFDESVGGKQNLLSSYCEMENFETARICNCLLLHNLSQ